VVRVAPGGHIQRRHFDLSNIITALSYSASLPRYLPTGIIGTSFRRILQLAFVSDIAIFVLKRDVKLQLTNFS